MLFLTAAAVVGGPPMLADSRNRGATGRARGACSVVNIEFGGKVAGCPFPDPEVPYRRASIDDCRSKCLFNCHGKDVAFLSREHAGGAGGVDARTKQGFAGIDVADTRYYPAVHDELLSCDLTAAALPEEISAVKGISKRFGADGGKQWMLQRVPRFPTERGRNGADR